jgi:hypothetical protein
MGGYAPEQRLAQQHAEGRGLAASALPYALIHPSAWNRSSPKFAQSRSNTSEHPWRNSTLFGYHQAFPDFLIIFIGRSLPNGGSWPIEPQEWASH